MTSENPIEQEQPTPNASGEPDKHTGEPQPAVTPAQTKSKPEPVPHKCDIACNKKRDWIDKTTLGLEGFGLFVLIVYTIFTGLMYCSNKKAAEGAKSAADTAAKQLEMSERPWVVEDFAVSGPLLFMPNGNATITIQSTIRNVGHSVAVDVQDYIAGFPEEFGNFTKVEDEQKEMCDRMRDRPKLSKTGSGAILFPGGEPYVADNTLTFSKESIMKARLPRGKEFAPEILSFVIYGCVNYGFTFSKEHHQTGFAYKVIRPPLGGLTIGSRSIKLGQNLPASELAIRRYPFAGFYIDWIQKEQPAVKAAYDAAFQQQWERVLDCVRVNVATQAHAVLVLNSGVRFDWLLSAAGNAPSIDECDGSGGGVYLKLAEWS